VPLDGSASGNGKRPPYPELVKSKRLHPWSNVLTSLRVQELLLSDNGRREIPDARAGAIIGVGDQRNSGKSPPPAHDPALGNSRASGGVRLGNR
jgi:hypothetical protein